MKKILTYIGLMFLSFVYLFVMTACNKVEFKLNFIVDNEIYTTINTNGEEVIKMPTNPSKEGFTFDGWYWDENYWQKPFTANSLLDAPLSSDMNVYAKWITPEELVNTQISIKFFNKVSETEYSIKVSNETKTIALNEYIIVNSKSKWALSTDIYGNDTITSKVASLVIGDNTYYILVTADNGSTQLYTLRIRRRPIYNVIFDTKGGTSVEMQQVEEDSFATVPTTTKVGYTFASWNYNFDNPIVDNTIVVASWTANRYKINYDVDGGAIETNYTNVVYNQTYQLSIPTKRGYTFQGWYQGDKLIENGVYTTPTDINVKARWRLINYDITYDLNGENVECNNPLTYSVESDNIVLNNPIKLGYEFLGWTGTDLTEPTRGVVIYNNSIGDRDYVANWKLNEYTINYHLNNGINNQDNPIKYTVVSENIHIKNPTREGYIFEGWYKKDNFDNNSKVNSIVKGSTGDMDLYAKWTPVTYFIRFNLAVLMVQ